MIERTRRAAPVALILLTACAPAAAVAAPAAVTVRVEGAPQHDLRRPGDHRRSHGDTTQSGGTHGLRRNERGRSTGPHARADGNRRRLTTLLGSDPSHGMPQIQRELRRLPHQAASAPTPRPPAQFWGLRVNQVNRRRSADARARITALETRCCGPMTTFGKGPALRLRGPGRRDRGPASARAGWETDAADGSAGARRRPSVGRRPAAGRRSHPALRHPRRLPPEGRAGRLDPLQRLVALRRPARGRSVRAAGDALGPRLQWALPGRLASERGRCADLRAFLGG